MADRITIARDQSAAIEAAELLQTVRDLRSVYERLARIQAKMYHAFDSGPTIDWSQVETLWGIPTGNGVDVFTLIDGAVLAMTNGQQNDSCKVLTERVG